MQYPFIVAIDGSIGAGKSTILNYLNQKYKTSIDTEPIDIWQPFLNDLYNCKPSAPFNIQVRVWLDRCMIPSIRYKQQQGLLAIERSPQFQRGVFIPANRTDGLISDIQYGLLMDMYDQTDTLWTPDLYIYLRASPDGCKKRIDKRARESEDSIPFDYLVTLNNLHEDCYIKAVEENRDIHVIEVADKTVEEIGETVWSIIQSKYKPMSRVSSNSDFILDTETDKAGSPKFTYCQGC